MAEPLSLYDYLSTFVRHERLQAYTERVGKPSIFLLRAFANSRSRIPGGFFSAGVADITPYAIMSPMMSTRGNVIGCRNPRAGRRWTTILKHCSKDVGELQSFVDEQR